MPVSHSKTTKAPLLKLFVIDHEGVYVGEHTVDSECVVEFDDFIKAIGNMAMTDRQTVFVGEYKATMLHGGRLSLVAISKGPLSNVEIEWAKATLTTVEAQLTERFEEERQSETTSGQAEAEMEGIKARLSKAESQLMEKEKLVEEATRHLEERAAELKARDDKLRELESKVVAATAAEEKERKDIEALREELEATKARIPSYDVNEAKKDIEKRIKILQGKALELLDREEKLRKREEEMSQVVVG